MKFKIPILHKEWELSIIQNSNTLSMEEMYKMIWLHAQLLYAISVIVQCDRYIIILLRQLAQFVLTALIIV